jgi:hypothetical protein
MGKVELGSLLGHTQHETANALLADQISMSGIKFLEKIFLLVLALARYY